MCTPGIRSRMDGHFNKVKLLWQFIPNWIPRQRKSLKLRGTVTLVWLITTTSASLYFLWYFPKFFCASMFKCSFSKFLIPLYFYSIVYFQIALDIGLFNSISLSKDSGFVFIINSQIIYWINSSAYLYESLPFAFLRFPLWFPSFI